MKKCLLVGLFMMLAGCGREVCISSEPVRARVEIEGSFVGYTPVQLRLGSYQQDIRLVSPGFRPVEAKLRRHLDPRILPLWLLPPAMMLPGVATRLDGHYHIKLTPGTEPEYRDPINGCPLELLPTE